MQRKVIRKLTLKIASKNLTSRIFFRPFVCLALCRKRRGDPSHQELQVWLISACRTITSFLKGNVSVRLKRTTGVTRET